MKLEFSRQIFEKYSNIKFHENPSSGSRVVPRGRTDMTKLIVAFHLTHDTWITRLWSRVSQHEQRAQPECSSLLKTGNLWDLVGAWTGKSLVIFLSYILRILRFVNRAKIHSGSN
jgi:hypothetical protein